MKRVFLAFILPALMGGMGAVWAQGAVQTVERSVKAVPNKDTQIGVYLNVLPDCTSGPLPTIRLASPPSSGKVVQLQGMPCARSAGLCRLLQITARIPGR